MEAEAFGAFDAAGGFTGAPAHFLRVEHPIIRTPTLLILALLRREGRLHHILVLLISSKCHTNQQQ